MTCDLKTNARGEQDQIYQADFDWRLISFQDLRDGYL